MKKVWTLAVLAMVLSLISGSAWAQKGGGDEIPIYKPLVYTTSPFDLPGATLDTNAIYTGTAATIRKVAIGQHFKGASDDTIRVVTVQGSSTRYLIIATDTTTTGYGKLKYSVETPYSFPSGSTPHAVAVGDIDGNGYTDILVGQSATPYAVRRFEWDGSTWLFRDSIALNNAVNDIVIGDADNDGTADEVLFNIAQTTQSCIMRARLVGGVWDTTRILLTGTQAARGLAIGDVRSDQTGNEVYVVGGTTMWMVHWDGSWTSSAITTGVTGAYDVAIGDIDPTRSGNELGVVHGSTSYQVTVSDWNGAAWSIRAWALTGSWGTSLNDIALGDVMYDNPGNELVLTPGGQYTPLMFWISPAGSAWMRSLVRTASGANNEYGAAIGNVDRFLNGNEFVLTGGSSSANFGIIEGEFRQNTNDLGTYYYKLTSGAVAREGVNDTIRVAVFNAGTSAQSGFNVGYRFKNSAETGSVVYSGTLNSGDWANIDIPFSFGFSGFDTMYVYVNSDDNVANDTTKLHLEILASGDLAVAYSGFNGTAFAPTNATYSPTNPAANEWKATIVTGSYNWSRVTSGTNPTIAAPLEGAGMTRYPCYSASSGSSARLRTNQVQIGPTPRKVRLQLYMYHDTGYSTSYDSIYVQYSFDDLNWTTVGGFQRYSATNGWVAHDVEIGDFAGNGTVYLSLLALSKFGNNMFIDSVRAYTADPTSPTTDAGVTAISNPGIVAPGQAFTVTATVRNYGLNDLTSTAVYYTLGGADTVRETWTGSLGIGQTAQFSFATQLSLPDSGFYTLYSGTELAGDENPANDTTSLVIRAYGIYSMPYVQNFNDAIWLPADCDTLRYSSGATVAGIWTRETAGTSPTCTPYEGAAMAKFNSFNAQSGNQVMFISPRIATGAANAVGLSFAFYGDPGYPSNGDSILIDITTDDGANWTRGVAGFWRYEATAAWRLYNVNLGSIPADTIRVALRAKSAYGNNMFVDDIHIYDLPPTVTYTSPDSGATGVLVDAPLVVGFSEPINQGSFATFCTPDPGVWSYYWNAAGDTATITHTPFATSTEYTFQVSAFDMTGNPLVPGAVPNPITFTTNADGTHPTASVVSPAWGATYVPLSEPIVLAFSEPMNTGSVDGYTDPSHDFTPSWNATGDTMTLTPDTMYEYSTLYTLIATAGTDLAGYSLVPLPDTLAQFTTIPNQGPQIDLVEQPGDTYDGTGPFLVRAVITDPAKKLALADGGKQGVASTELTYTTGTLEYTIPGTPGAADTFDFSIPGGFSPGTVVSYYLYAEDDQGDGNYSPVNAPVGVYQFRVLDPLPPTALGATAGDMMVQLDWAPPAELLSYDQNTVNYWWPGCDAGLIFSTRFTPQHYPCKLEQAISLWTDNIGMDSVLVHIYADDGTGMPDEGNQLVTPFKILPLSEVPTVVDLSGYDLVLASGDFHIGYEILTTGMPVPYFDNYQPPDRSLYKDLDTYWYAIGVNNLHQAAVTYSSYSKQGLALKSARLNKGQKPNYNLHNTQASKLLALKTKQAPQYAKLTGALARAKNIGGYSVLRSLVDGGPYSFLSSASNPTYTDQDVQNGTPYYYVVRAEYTMPDTFSANSNQATATPAGMPILLVDDDGQVVGNPTWIDGQPYYTAALDGAGYTGQYSVFEKEWGVDGPAADWYQGRDAVIWFTSYNWNGNLSANDMTNLAGYLDAGGKLFLCGQDVLYYTGLNTFTQNYLGVQAATQDGITTDVNLAGISGSLAEGFNYALSSATAIPELYADDLTAIAGAGYVFDVTAKVGEKPAVQYDNGTFRSVFFAFPFENITDGANTKAELMYRILNWMATGVEGNPTVEAKPTVFSLASNYPNPVRANTTIKFATPKDSDVRIEVFNVVGQRVRTLVNGRLNAGYHQVAWNGANDRGQKVAAGVYLVRMAASEYTATRKMTVLR